MVFLKLTFWIKCIESPVHLQLRAARFCVNIPFACVRTSWHTDTTAHNTVPSWCTPESLSVLFSESHTISLTLFQNLSFLPAHWRRCKKLDRRRGNSTPIASSMPRNAGESQRRRYYHGRQSAVATMKTTTKWQKTSPRRRSRTLCASDMRVAFAHLSDCERKNQSVYDWKMFRNFETRKTIKKWPEGGSNNRCRSLDDRNSAFIIFSSLSMSLSLRKP